MRYKRQVARGQNLGDSLTNSRVGGRESLAMTSKHPMGGHS